MRTRIPPKIPLQPILTTIAEGHLDKWITTDKLYAKAKVINRDTVWGGILWLVRRNLIEKRQMGFNHNNSPKWQYRVADKEKAIMELKGKIILQNSSEV